ncbi:MAG: protein kinase domain-containing protein, partial [Terriglobia bacterium]
IGTPQYMSPEQALGKRGDDLDGRSDLYSLGIVMYQMLTGEVPFKGETTMQVLFAQVHTPAKPIREVRPDLQVPGCIERVVMKCLEKDRDLRPNDAGTLIEEIAQAEAEAARARTGFEPLPQATPETEQTARLPAETGRLVKERAERENLVRQQREESRRRIFDPQITETHSVTGGERPDGKRLQEERQSAEQSRQSRLTPQQFERIFGKQEEAKPELPRPVRREADRLSGLGVSPERPADQQTRKPQIQNTVVSGPVAPTGSRKTAALLTAAVIILLGAGAWYFYQSQHQELSQQPSSSTSVNPTSPPQPSQPEGPAPASTSPQSSVPPNTTAATVANPSTETTPPQSSPKSETLTTATVTNQLRIATIIRTGDRFLHKQNYARAIRAYQSGLKLDPANSELLAKLKQARIEAKAPRAEPVAGESHPAPAPQAPAARLAETSAPTTIPAQPAVPSTGALRVSAPAGAAIYIDGDSAGKVAANGSLLVSHLSPGNHQVRLALSGYQIWNGSINVQPGQTTSSAITLAAVPQPQVVSFHVTHQHTFGSCSGTLTIGNGRMSYDASKKSHSFDVPLTSIAKFGTVRYGADFYFELKNGRDYLFSGPMAALQAFERAREAAGPSLGSKVGQPSK